MLNDTALNMLRLSIQLQWYHELNTSKLLGATDDEIIGELLMALENRPDTLGHIPAQELPA